MFDEHIILSDYKKEITIQNYSELNNLRKENQQKSHSETTKRTLMDKGFQYQNQITNHL